MCVRRPIYVCINTKIYTYKHHIYIILYSQYYLTRNGLCKLLNICNHKRAYSRIQLAFTWFQ